MYEAPNAIAVTDEDLVWTYDALRKRSDLVAGSLASHGITRGGVVGMLLPRCADAIAAMLGIMVSGCVYLPLDPAYPPARIRSMLDRAGAIAVISRGSNPDLYAADRIRLPSPSQLAVEPEMLSSELPTFSAETKTLRPEDRAYILFTSGSTGEPKGVMVTHGNITVMTEWSREMLGFTKSDASATSCSLSFDASFHETLLPLSVGGTVHVISHALALGQLNRKVSLVATTPTVANELLRAGLLPLLKVLMVGGEVLTPDVAARLLSSGRVGRLFNCYGPTECTVCVTMAEVTAPVPQVISIGRQVPGTEVLILGEDGQELPGGQLGEICIFGQQVTDGYVNDVAGTAERFVVHQDPASRTSQRYYRTGDLGYRLDDGVIHFVGRADRQVKINGYRIELAEIDAALRAYPQISEAATLVQDDDRIVSYVAPAHAGSDIGTSDLKMYLSENLPAFMLPVGIVVLPELPKTVSGKLDSSRLPRWTGARSEQEPLEIDELTARVIQVVADVTGFIGQIRPSDDFINDLGGTSLGLVRVLVELEHDSGRQLRVSDALADTSIAGLANLLSGDSVSSLADFTFNQDGSAPPLFLLHAYFGGMLALRCLAELLPKDQPVYGLHVYPAGGHVNDTVTISSLARDAVRRMRAIQPDGRITISGSSAGGLIAFEAARHLIDAGDREPKVLLLDAVLPHSTFGYCWGDLLLTWRELIRDPFRIVRAFGQLINARHAEAKNVGQLEMAKMDEAYTIVPIRRYRGQPYNGNVTVLRTRQARALALGRRYLGWKSVVKGTITMIDVPGTHMSMFDDPHINFVAKAMVDWLSSE